MKDKKYHNELPFYNIFCFEFLSLTCSLKVKKDKIDFHQQGNVEDVEHSLHLILCIIKLSFSYYAMQNLLFPIWDRRKVNL